MRRVSRFVACSGRTPRSVVYRTGSLTPEDYDEAIVDLKAARSQRLGDPCCAVCEDSGHYADQCHHNPLVLARRFVQHREAMNHVRTHSELEEL